MPHDAGDGAAPAAAEGDRVHQVEVCALRGVACVLTRPQGNLSASTTRVPRAVLPQRCLWANLLDVDELSFDVIIRALKELYPAADSDDNDNDSAEPRPRGLSGAAPEVILSIIRHQGAVEALRLMIWYLRTLIIDPGISSMKNFYLCDPMKKGQGLVLDGQMLTHIQVCTSKHFCILDPVLYLPILGYSSTDISKQR